MLNVFRLEFILHHHRPLQKTHSCSWSFKLNQQNLLCKRFSDAELTLRCVAYSNYKSILLSFFVVHLYIIYGAQWVSVSFPSGLLLLSPFPPLSLVVPGWHHSLFSFCPWRTPHIFSRDQIGTLEERTPEQEPREKPSKSVQHHKLAWETFGNFWPLKPSHRSCYCQKSKFAEWKTHSCAVPSKFRTRTFFFSL